jgi:transposase
VTVDRDLNGARGIFLKALVDSPDLRKKVAFISFC